MKSDGGLVAAILPAAGRGSRLGGGTLKQFRLLGDKPLLVHSLEGIVAAGVVQWFVVVVPPADLEAARGLLQGIVPHGIALEVVAGGARRQDSVAAGLAVLPDGYQVVVVHDAVRPFPRPEWIIRTVALCQSFEGAVVALPATDTLKEVQLDRAASQGHSGIIEGTLPRDRIWQAQTPQAFRVEVLRRAFQNAGEQGLMGTDEAVLVESIGGRVAVVAGSPDNIKVTTPKDWAYLEWKLSHARGRRGND